MKSWFACTFGIALPALIANGLLAAAQDKHCAADDVEPSACLSATSSSSLLQPVPLSSTPRVYRLASLLSGPECDDLIALGRERLLRPSEIGAAEAHGTSNAGSVSASAAAAWRNSSTLTFSNGASMADPVLSRLQRRLANAALLPESLAEPLQLSRYRETERFGLHTDLDLHGRVLRLATVIVYLNDDFEGGETVFPRVPTADSAGHAGVPPLKPLHKLAAAGGAELLEAQLRDGLGRYCGDDGGRVLRVAPRKGDALLFFSFTPHLTPDIDAVHGGCPPRGGADAEKWILQQFFNLERQPRASGDAAAAAGPAPLPEAQGGQQLARRLEADAVAALRERLSSRAEQPGLESIAR